MNLTLYNGDTNWIPFLWPTMYYDSLYVFSLVSGFSLYDRLLRKDGFKNPFFAIHAAHNAMLAYLTADDVYATITRFPIQTTHMDPIRWCVALHVYYILCYWRTFFLDEWLHHALILGVAIPLRIVYPFHTLMGYFIWFNSGVTGCIDYGLYFGVSNDWITHHTELRIRRFLTKWVRHPGFLAYAMLASMLVLQNRLDPMAILPAILHDYSRRRSPVGRLAY
jgi:hypothetical protein